MSPILLYVPVVQKNLLFLVAFVCTSEEFNSSDPGVFSPCVCTYTENT